MKKILLLIITVFSIYSAQAQCNTEAQMRIDKIEATANDFDNYGKNTYDSLRKEASAVFMMLEKCVIQNPSFEASSKIKKFRIYFLLSEVAGQQHKYPEMLKNIEAMERILPSPSAISSSAAASFYIDGKNYTSTVDYEYIANLYYEGLERRVNYYYFATADYSKVIEWYEKLNVAPASFERSDLEALLYADAMYKNGKPVEKYFPAMANAALLYGKDWAKSEDHDSSQINNKDLMLRWFRREINEYNKATLNTADFAGRYRMISARGLWDLQEKELAKQYALSASEAGYSSASDGYWYLDVVANGEQKHVIGALNILEKSVPGMTEQEMDRLLPLAERYGQQNMVDAIRARKRKIVALRRRSQISLTPGIELIGLPCGHVPVSLNLRTGRVWQEFMFDYVWGAKSRYRFGRAFDKGEKGNRYHYTGWDAGYAINIMLGKEYKRNIKGGRAKFYSPAVGLDFRYANWNLGTITSDMYDVDGNFQQAGVVTHPTTVRYEVCYRTSFIFMTKYFHLHYWVGLGVGYRSLKTSEGYDVETNRFNDPRLDHTRWNKIYMPLRLGLKIGFNAL